MYGIYLLISYILIQIAHGMEICGSISSFDAVCRNGSFIYVISANPCIKQTDISLSIIDTTKGNIKQKYLSTGVTPITTDDENREGVVIVIHSLPAPSIKEYHRSARVHVMLYAADMKLYKQNATGLQLLLKTDFAVFPDRCDTKDDRDQNWGHLSNKNCDVSASTGEFSTICFVKSSNNIPAGFYLTSFDPCSVPYSTVLIVMLQSGITYKERFTQDKKDPGITLSPSNDGCGLTLDMHLHVSMEYHLELKQSCPSKAEVSLIDAMHKTAMGMICPLSACETPSNNPLIHSCHVPWISGPHGQTNMSHVTATLNMCKTPVEVTMQLFVKGMPFTERATLIASRKSDIRQAVLLQLKTHFENEKCTSKKNGYLCLDGGHVSLVVHENKTLGLFRIAILRHYPDLTHVVPLLHTEYWVRPQQTCSGASKSKSKVVAVAVTIVLLLLLFCVAVFLWWKRRKSVRRHTNAGLPYEIHLGEQELDNIDY